MTSSVPSRQYVILGNPENRRVGFFQSALAKLGLPPALVVAYKDFLERPDDLNGLLERGCVLRIESPGENWEVERALLALGSDQDDGESLVPRLSRDNASNLPFDKGRILHSAQWYFGFRAAMEMVRYHLSTVESAEVMNHPDDIVTMFDKRACHAALATAGVPVPAALPPIHTFEELLQRMAESGWSRVFIKPRYGSSASGVIAFARNQNRMVAYTSVELARTAGQVKLYNSLRLRKYETTREIQILTDLLCRDRVHVEKWVPKASLEGRSFDLRVVVIGRRATHAVVRTSSTPVTNLHLGNKRGEIGAVRERMGSENWQAAMRTCERVLEVFPHAHYAGIDLAIEVGFHNEAVLEVNAFGDLLPNVLTNGMDTYQAEIAAFHGRHELVSA